MPKLSKKAQVEYPNLLSRLVLADSVDEQFPFPLRPRPKLETWWLRWYERHVLRVDTRNITIDRPIFLVGLPRTGTTMLQDILCSHPEVGYLTNLMPAYPDCFCAAHVICKRLHIDFKLDRFLGDSVEIELGSANEGLSILKGFEDDFYSLKYRELRIGDFPPDLVEEWRQTIKRILWCFGGTARRFFNKNPEFLVHIRFLKELFPDARIIYLIRDPRACANSMVKLCRLVQAQEVKLRGGSSPAGLFVPYPRLPKLAEYVARYGAADIRTTANLWNDSIPFVEACASECSFLTVRYEDILADPTAEISKILDFCELPEVGESVERFWDKIRGIGVLRHSNQYSDFELIEEICRANMERYGY
ncbi:MAG: sulfotransferase family protein [Bryobacteraceae bacterium]